MATLATNKKAFSELSITEKLEAGIALTGAEVKSVKKGQINLKGSYISIDTADQVWLVGAHIARYKPAGGAQEQYQPDHNRRLLVHRQEINYLRGKSKEKGLTIVPLSVYTKGGLIKVEVGIGTGKKKYDKRSILRRRIVDREIQRTLKDRRSIQ